MSAVPLYLFRSVDLHQNYFNVLELHPSRVALDIYRAISPESTQSDFGPMKRWTAPLSLDQHRLTLGDWTPS